MTNPPIKRTSSKYYAELRAKLDNPKRRCEFCGAILVRWYNEQSGRYEDYTSFINRRCCGNSCAQKLRAAKLKTEKQKKMYEGYLKCKDIDGLYVNRDGRFIYNGKEKKVLRYTDRYKRKHTALLKIRQGKRLIAVSAARLVAKTFRLRNYTDEDAIIYKDGNIHNICIENLSMMRRSDYDRMMMEHISSHRKQGTYQYQVDRLNINIESNTAVLHYFTTGDFCKVNDFVSKYLYNCLCSYCIKDLYLGTEQAQIFTGDAIARWYEVLLQGHAVGNGERYCKKILAHFKRHGWYGNAGRVPQKKIELIINKLNLDCLWERYKVTRLKK